MATPRTHPATSLSVPLHASSQLVLALSGQSLVHSSTPTRLFAAGNGKGMSFTPRNPQQARPSWIALIRSPCLLLKSDCHLSLRAQPNPPTGEMCVPARVAMTVVYTTRSRTVRVDGKRTAGMFEACRREYLWWRDKEEARAVEVSRATPDRRGRKRARAVKVLDIGRE